jgi:hypothetical protein
VTRAAMGVRAATAALVLGGALAPSSSAKAVDLAALSKFLAYIEGFQYVFEICEAETKLPAAQVAYARKHIAERRALIFAGLHEIQRDKVIADMPPKKAAMIKGMMDHIKKEEGGTPLKELCKKGYFEGVVASEQESEAKEVAEIRKAKK